MGAAQARAHREARVTPRSFGREPLVWLDAQLQQSGSTVWEDFSANQRDTYQNNAGNIPIWNFPALNGNAGWDFDGNDWQQWDIPAHPTFPAIKRGDGFHFLVVVNEDDGTNDQALWSKMNANGTRTGIRLQHEPGSNRIRTSMETGSVGNRCTPGFTTVADVGGHLWEWLYDGSSTSAGNEGFQDGVQLTRTNFSDSLSAAIDVSEAAQIGRNLESPSSGGPGQYYNGDICLFIAFAVTGGPEPLGADAAQRLRRQIVRRFAL